MTFEDLFILDKRKGDFAPFQNPSWRHRRLPGLGGVRNKIGYLRGQIEEVERAARRMIDELSAELLDSYWDFLES